MLSSKMIQLLVVVLASPAASIEGKTDTRAYKIILNPPPPPPIVGYM